jgi:cytochrome c553
MTKLLTAVFVFCVACVTPFMAQAQDVKGNAAAGEKKNAMCIGCHGIKGYQASFPEVYRVPMISGQTAKYITASLNAYKKGERKHPTMRAISDSLSDQDIADLAAYYEAHAGSVKAESEAIKAPSERVAALIARDKDNACTTCHGVNFNTPKDGTVPKLAGQHADYLLVALKAYKVENNPQVGRANGVMSGNSKKFNNAELKELANYISSLDGGLKTVPEAKFR